MEEVKVMKKQVAQAIVRLAELSAKKAIEKASPWGHYQPKESDSVREWASEKSKK